MSIQSQIGVNSRNWRPLALGAIFIGILAHFLLLSPAQVDENSPQETIITPGSLEAEASALVKYAKGIPANRVPDYSVEQFDYASTQKGVKQWRLFARKANFYNSADIVHAVDVKAYLYDSGGKITLVTGKEAKFSINYKDLEIFGDVKTVFPDEFEVESDHLRYLPKDGLVMVPGTERVAGRAKESNGQRISFTGFGLYFKMSEDLVILEDQVRFINSRMVKNAKSGELERQDTVIDSDGARIYRKRQLAQFDMRPEKKSEERFVQIYEPSMYCRGRTAELNYGNYEKLLNYMSASEEVMVKEKGPDISRYSTSGRADFDSQKNIVILTQFPQVYQDDDTVTGDVVILHRDSDIVEVEHSNAFSAGKQESHSSANASSDRPH
jgi:LPS export ABC transporter protein LptC